MSLGAFVQQPQVNPFVGGAVPAVQPQNMSALEACKLDAANRRPQGFIAGVTAQDVAVYTVENPYPDAEHGDVTIFRRPSGSVGVQQFINGIWKTLYNEDEAKKKFGQAPPIPAPAPMPTSSFPPTSNQVLGITILGATTDNSLFGQSAEDKTVGIVKRDSGTIGVKQVINGKWETLYTEAEAVKKFAKSGGSMKRDQVVVCPNCEEDLFFSGMQKAKDGYYYCCEDCMEEAGTEPI